MVGREGMTHLWLLQSLMVKEKLNEQARLNKREKTESSKYSQEREAGTEWESNLNQTHKISHFCSGVFVTLSPSLLLLPKSDQWVKKKKLNYALTSLLLSSKWLAYKLECISQKNFCSSCGCLWYTWCLRRNIWGLLTSQVKLPAISTGSKQRHTELEEGVMSLSSLWIMISAWSLNFCCLWNHRPHHPIYLLLKSLCLFIRIQVKEWRGSLHESLDLVREKDLLLLSVPVT